MSFTLRSPETDQEWSDYFRLRWQILRAPWQQPPGSEQDDLEDTSYHVMVMDDNSLVIGTGRIHQLDNFTAQIRYMAVAKEFQGHGAGSQILAQLESKARDWRCREIVLNARINCLGFYAKRDYEILGEAPTLFGSIVHKRMRKQLEI